MKSEAAIYKQKQRVLQAKIRPGIGMLPGFSGPNS